MAATAMSMRVCVIGAGPAGLCAAYHLQKAGIVHVVFEQAGCPGGTWVYEEHGNDVHSSMYRDLRTNLPVEIMAFPNFPFPEDTQAFVHHSVIRAYLDNFYKKNIEPHGNVRFNTKVIKVQRGLRLRWDVDVDSAGKHSTESFSHILICNGHYTVPRLPEVVGLETFTGSVQHSHTYRFREKYTGKRVVIIGAGFSGVDIALEIATVAKQCLLSHNQNAQLNLAGVVEKGPVIRVTGSTFFFESDDRVDDVDDLIFCTGYRISAPFVDEFITIDGGFRVRDLFRQSILISDPTIAFIGVPRRVVTCPMFDYQVRYALALFKGSIPLPGVDEMRQEQAEEERERDVLGMTGPKFAHDMKGPLLWTYLQRFVDDGLGPLNPRYRRAYEASHAARRKDFAGYRDKPLNL